MNIFNNKLRLAFASVLLSALLPVSAFATPTFVGTFQTDDGPWWSSNPAVYSAVEAAALLFGGVASDYRISTNNSMDASTITDTGWYSIIGVGGGHQYADDFKRDFGPAGYGGSGWNSYHDISAYVGDNARGAQYTMYVWRNTVAATVAEPGTLALLGMGLLGLGVARRQKQ